MASIGSVERWSRAVDPCADAMRTYVYASSLLYSELLLTCESRPVGEALPR